MIILKTSQENYLRMKANNFRQTILLKNISKLTLKFSKFFLLRVGILLVKHFRKYFSSTQVQTHGSELAFKIPTKDFLEIFKKLISIIVLKEV